MCSLFLFVDATAVQRGLKKQAKQNGQREKVKQNEQNMCSLFLFVDATAVQRGLKKQSKESGREMIFSFGFIFCREICRRCVSVVMQDVGYAIPCYRIAHRGQNSENAYAIVKHIQSKFEFNSMFI